MGDPRATVATVEARLVAVAMQLEVAWLQVEEVLTGLAVVAPAVLVVPFHAPALVSAFLCVAKLPRLAMSQPLVSHQDWAFHCPSEPGCEVAAVLLQLQVERQLMQKLVTQLVLKGVLPLVYQWPWR